MFNGLKKPHFRINDIENNLTIGDLFDESFRNESEAETFLNNL